MLIRQDCAHSCFTCCGMKMFEFYNTVLRAKGKLVPFGDRYPMLKGETTTKRFVTTIHAVNSGIIKLAELVRAELICSRSVVMLNAALCTQHP